MGITFRSNLLRPLTWDEQDNNNRFSYEWSGNIAYASENVVLYYDGSVWSYYRAKYDIPSKPNFDPIDWDRIGESPNLGIASRTETFLIDIGTTEPPFVLQYNALSVISVEINGDDRIENDDWIYDSNSNSISYVSTLYPLLTGYTFTVKYLFQDPTVNPITGATIQVEWNDVLNKPNATTTINGLVEIATQSEFDTNTDIGATGAYLLAPISIIKDYVDTEIANIAITISDGNGTTWNDINGSVDLGGAISIGVQLLMENSSIDIYGTSHNSRLFLDFTDVGENSILLKTSNGLYNTNIDLISNELTTIASILMNASDGTNTNSINLTNIMLRLSNSMSGNVLLDNTGMYIESLLLEGVKYLGFGESDNNDTLQTANYDTLVNTSLVPKQYVDSRINAIPIITANDGLTILNDNITLGGIVDTSAHLIKDATEALYSKEYTGFRSFAYYVTKISDGFLIGLAGGISYQGYSSGLIKVDVNGNVDKTLDIKYGPNGSVLTIQEYQSQYYIGGFSYFDNTPTHLARVNSDGTLDTSFNLGGTGFSSTVNHIEILSDGRILAGGRFTTYNDVSANRIIRLNNDGSIDNTFSIGTGFNNDVEHFTIDNAGNIYVVGRFTSYNGVTASRIIKLLSDGSIDGTFVYGTGINGDGGCVIYDANVNAILIAGAFSTYNGTASSRIARILPNGTIDSTFLVGTGFNNTTSHITIAPDGKYLVTGSGFSTYQGNASKGLVRINQNGSYDSTLVLGTGFDGQTLGAAVNNDTIVVVGFSYLYQGNRHQGVTALNYDGTPSTKFPTFANSYSQGVFSAAVDSKNRYVTGGFFDYYDNHFFKIVRTFYDNSIDTSFQITGMNGTINKILMFPDDSFLIIGSMTTYNGTAITRIAKIRENGQLDTTFQSNVGTGFSSSNILDAIFTSDGKILIGGAFTTFNGVNARGLVRLNLDGTLDNTFVSGFTTSITVRSVRELPDGRYILGISNYGGVYNGVDVGIACIIFPDGTLDNTFNTKLAFEPNGYEIFDTLLLDNGDILLMGEFDGYDTNPSCKGAVIVQQNAQLSTTYSLDVFYRLNSSSAPVIYKAVSHNGKIYIGGNFYKYGTYECGGLICFNSDFTIDTTFNAGERGIYPTEFKQMFFADDVLHICSFSTHYNNFAIPFFLRLNADGSPYLRTNMKYESNNALYGYQYDYSSHFNENNFVTKKYVDSFGANSININSVLFVSPTGNDATAVIGNISKPWRTLTGAKNAAVSGQLIYVYPGTYSTNNTNILKNGVNWYFMHGAIVAVPNAVPIFNDNGLGAITCTIYGEGEFSNVGGFWGNDTTVINLRNASNITIYCKRISSLAAWNNNQGIITVYNARIDGQVVPYNSGRIYLYNCFLDDCEFIGSAYNVTNSHLVLENCRLERRTLRTPPGSLQIDKEAIIHWEGEWFSNMSNSLLRVKGCKFVNKVIDNEAYGIYIREYDMTNSNVEIFDNDFQIDDLVTPASIRIDYSNTSIRPTYKIRNNSGNKPEQEYNLTSLTFSPRIKNSLPTKGVVVNDLYEPQFYKNGATPLTMPIDFTASYTKDYKSLDGFASPFYKTEDGYEIDLRDASLETEVVEFYPDIELVKSIELKGNLCKIEDVFYSTVALSNVSYAVRKILVVSDTTTPFVATTGITQINNWLNGVSIGGYTSPSINDYWELQISVTFNVGYSKSTFMRIKHYPIK